MYLKNLYLFIKPLNIIKMDSSQTFDIKAKSGNKKAFSPVDHPNVEFMLNSIAYYIQGNILSNMEDYLKNINTNNNHHTNLLTNEEIIFLDDKTIYNEITHTIDIKNYESPMITDILTFIVEINSKLNLSIEIFICATIFIDKLNKIKILPWNWRSIIFISSILLITIQPTLNDANSSYSHKELSDAVKIFNEDEIKIKEETFLASIDYNITVKYRTYLLFFTEIKGLLMNEVKNKSIILGPIDKNKFENEIHKLSENYEKELVKNFRTK
jgi:hypothetical protein